MKKIILLVILATLFQGMFVFAQDSRRNVSDYYFFTVPIEKIYLYRLGYVVLYRTNSNGIGRTYIPHEWFTAAGKGDLIYLTGPEGPTMTVYEKNGEFSHVRLRLRKERLHPIWNAVPQAANLAEYFVGVEEVKLEF